ncbi:MAG: cupin domain-containing protein [Desulfovermiculus sp.]|nr:cupin domain-containing protein [Desulfovermiculus sp.]
MSDTPIGTRVKKLRQAREISLDELASRTDLSLSFLTSLEEEDIYPSLGPLLKISRTLGLRLGTFLDDKVSRDPLIVRLEQREEELHMLRGKDHPVSLRFYSLGKGKNDRHMEPFFIQILPESARHKDLSTHEGEEFIVVHSGRVEVIYGEDTHILEPGDSIYYNSIVPHHVACIGDEPAEVYAVLYLAN